MRCEILRPERAEKNRPVKKHSEKSNYSLSGLLPQLEIAQREVWFQ
jgi:hypothetical protein